MPPEGRTTKRLILSHFFSWGMLSSAYARDLRLPSRGTTRAASGAAGGKLNRAVLGRNETSPNLKLGVFAGFFAQSRERWVSGDAHPFDGAESWLAVTAGALTSIVKLNTLNVTVNFE